MKNQWLKICIKFIVPLFLLGSCVKGDSVPDPIADKPLFNSPDNFNYETSKEVGIQIQLLTNDNQPLSKVQVKILDKTAEENGTVLFTAFTDNNGKISSTSMLPTYLKKVIVDPGYIGVMRNAIVNIVDQKVLCTIGGSQGYSGNIEAGKTISSYAEMTGRTQALTYKYMGTYDSLGKPNYLESSNDVISSTLLSYVNASLPERKPLPTYHPNYLSGSAQTNLNLVLDGDIYITFVHEGAGLMNSLAYFTYPTNNPPTSPGAIDTLTMIFPNASLVGSAGNLTSGNKVKLGRFKAGTSIGFCLVSNGWNASTKLVGGGNGQFFSIDALNPESNAANKRHAALLYDNTNNLFLVGMEDINRENGSDNDFNDIIFYATSVNSSNAISQVNVNPIDKPGDTDGDGVSDIYDQFPNDAAKAYVNYYPSSSTVGSVAFEDTWPNTGDYDMNDVIVDYRYAIINDGLNNTVEVYADYILKASGASFNNGFGVQFPFSPSLISTVTGYRHNNAFNISMNANGTESGQNKAVIIPFNDFFYVSPRSTANSTINTQPELPFRVPDTLRMKMTFVSPISSSTLGAAPFNQFIFASFNRGKEVHLPNFKPTDIANTGYFNTLQDNTIPSQNRYYKSKSNLPFGIGLPLKFNYPIEGKAINTVYLKFNEWAQSGGIAYPDWYLDSPGYRSPYYFYK